MAEHGGQGGGGVDDVVLDEDFVRGATISELDAAHRAKARAKAQAKADKRERRLYRRHVRRRRLRRAVQGLVIVAGVVVLGAAAGASGLGPLSFLQGDEADVEELATRVSSASPAPTDAPATTVVSLERKSYSPGDCVLWDRAAGRFGTPNRVAVVSCDRPHLMEVTGRVELPSGPYPSQAEWSAMVDTGRCAEVGAAYVGGPLDPNGVYGSRGIIPQEEGWRAGDREVWCGLRRYPMEEVAAGDPAAELYTGAVDRDPGAQYRIYPVGSCLGPDGEGLTMGTVPCDGPHDVEIAGHVDLAGRVDQLPAPEELERLIGRDCQRQAKAYAGRNLRDPVSAGWLHIEQGSWDAGRRTLVCTVAEYRNHDVLTITRRIGAPPA